MTRDGILNAQLLSAIAHCGHTQTLVICDAGLPLPPGVPVIDLALVRGVPTFLEALKAIAGQLVVESYCYAQEMPQANPGVLSQMQEILAGLPSTQTPHEEFKRLTQTANAILRTGECSSYANVILTAGVNF